MKGYFSENSPRTVRQQLKRCEVLVNGVRNDHVVACDTELGFAICLVRDPEKETDPKRRSFAFKDDPNGYKGRLATELIWGMIEIRPREDAATDDVELAHLRDEQRRAILEDAERADEHTRTFAPRSSSGYME